MSYKMSNPEDYTKNFERLSEQVSNFADTAPIPADESVPVLPTSSWGSKINKTTIAFIVAIPILILVLLVFFKPGFVTYVQQDNEGKEYKKLYIQKLLIWSVALSVPLLVAGWVYFYRKKKPTS